MRHRRAQASVSTVKEHADKAKGCRREDGDAFVQHERAGPRSRQSRGSGRARRERKARRSQTGREAPEQKQGERDREHRSVERQGKKPAVRKPPRVRNDVLDVRPAVELPVERQADDHGDVPSALARGAAFRKRARECLAVRAFHRLPSSLLHLTKRAAPPQGERKAFFEPEGRPDRNSPLGDEGRSASRHRLGKIAWHRLRQNGREAVPTIKRRSHGRSDKARRRGAAT